MKKIVFWFGAALPRHTQLILSFVVVLFFLCTYIEQNRCERLCTHDTISSCQCQSGRVRVILACSSALCYVAFSTTWDSQVVHNCCVTDAFYQKFLVLYYWKDKSEVSGLSNSDSYCMMLSCCVVLRSRTNVRMLISILYVRVHACLETRVEGDVYPCWLLDCLTLLVTHPPWGRWKRNTHARDLV